MATSGTAIIPIGETSVSVPISNQSFDRVDDGVGLRRLTKSYIVHTNFSRNVGNVSITSKTADSFTVAITNIDLADDTEFTWKVELI
jgi:hypothetical protein